MSPCNFPLKIIKIPVDRLSEGFLQAYLVNAVLSVHRGKQEKRVATSIPEKPL